MPVFSELLVQKRRREAIHAASALAGLLLLVLTAVTLLFILVAPWLMPLFTDTPALDDLTIGLSRVLFPIVVLLGLNGLVVGILNAHDHFSIPALAPLVWNVVIVVSMVVLTPRFEGDDELYAYAIGVVAGTAVQLAMCLAPLRRIGFPLRISFDFHDPHIRRVLILMLPVSLGLGLINVSLVLNSAIGFLVSDEAPAAIDKAFRIYMLPQGMFSVAVATVAFPALARLASRHDLPGMRALTGTGMRQIALLLIPSAAAIVALATPMARLVYERGEFDAESTQQVAEALLWFSFSLPFSGFNLLLTRTFFSLQRPWLPTKLALASVAVNAVVSLALYQPFGIAGIVLGTTVSNVVMTLLLGHRLRRELGGLEVMRTLRAVTLMTGAGVLLARDRLRDLVRARRPARALAAGAADLRRLRPGARRARLRRRAPAQRVAGGAPDRRPVRPEARGAPRRNLSGRPWPTSPRSATSRSSPTSTTGSRRWPTASSR